MGACLLAYPVLAVVIEAVPVEESLGLAKLETEVGQGILERPDGAVSIRASEASAVPRSCPAGASGLFRPRFCAERCANGVSAPEAEKGGSGPTRPEEDRFPGEVIASH